MDKYVLGSAIKPDQIDDSEAVDIELMPGDISIHNPFLIHGSNFNTSDRWRIGLTLRYIPTSTYVNRKKWDCVLLRGKSRKGIKNSYLKKPIFIDRNVLAAKALALMNNKKITSFLCIVLI